DAGQGRPTGVEACRQRAERSDIPVWAPWTVYHVLRLGWALFGAANESPPSRTWGPDDPLRSCHFPPGEATIPAPPRYTGGESVLRREDAQQWLEEVRNKDWHDRCLERFARLPAPLPELGRGLFGRDAAGVPLTDWTRRNETINTAYERLRRHRDAGPGRR